MPNAQPEVQQLSQNKHQQMSDRSTVIKYSELGPSWRLVRFPTVNLLSETKNVEWSHMCTYMHRAPCGVGMSGAAALPQTGGPSPLALHCADRHSKCSHTRSCGGLSVLRGERINRWTNREAPLPLSRNQPLSPGCCSVHRRIRASKASCSLHVSCVLLIWLIANLLVIFHSYNINQDLYYSSLKTLIIWFYIVLTWCIFLKERGCI